MFGLGLSLNPVSIVSVLGAIGVVIWMLLGKKSAPVTSTQTVPAPSHLSNLSNLGGRLRADLERAKAWIASLESRAQQQIASGMEDPVTEAAKKLSEIHAALAQLQTPEAQQAMLELEKLVGPLLVPLIKGAVLANPPNFPVIPLPPTPIQNP